MATDPLGLERCLACQNAFEHDAHAGLTKKWQEAGHTGFVCQSCVQDALDRAVGRGIRESGPVTDRELGLLVQVMERQL